MTLATATRTVERNIFGALIGTLVGVLVCRLVLLAVEVNGFVLAVLLSIGAWSGGFVAHLFASRAETATESLRGWALFFRRVCLRIMLWLLGAAALFGVLSVLTASYDIVGRVAATACVTAVAAGFLWPFSVMIDRDRWRGVGLFGAASVLLVYLLVTPAIWDLGHDVEEAAMAGLIVALMTPAGLIVMALLQSRTARVAGIVGMGLYTSVLTIFLAALWIPSSWYRGEGWWETGFIVAVFGAVAAANLVGVGTGDRRHWRWLGVLAAVVSGGMYVWKIWAQAVVYEAALLEIIGPTIAVAVAHMNLVMSVPLRGRQIWLRIATIITVALTAVCLDVELWLSLGSGPQSDGFARVALASGILASCGTLALIVLAGLNRIVARPLVEGKLESITVICPKCQKRQTIPLEAAACSRCGLEILVRIDDSAMEPPVAAESGPDG
jgi:hypothetical protein